MNNFHIYDTTMRDGAQQEGLNLSVEDKLAIARYLDAMKVTFIEAGWPGSNPVDTEFYHRAQAELDLQNATLVAFGATRRPGIEAADDPQVTALRDSGAGVVTLVAKSHDRHVREALRTTSEENLTMISDTVRFLRRAGIRVFVDCEHFFDSFHANRDYALSVVTTAASAGAEGVVLCDTNGGMLPHWIYEAVEHTAAVTDDCVIGIHAHNDTGCAVANSVAAVQAGATHLQGCVNGYGERTGNADLITCIANLQLKLGMNLIGDGLVDVTRLAHAIAEVTNYPPNPRQPYTGVSAFAHKAGLHASAIRINPDLYQHIDPDLVGNDMRLLVSGMAGRATIALKAKELGYDLDAETVTNITQIVKDRERCGYTYEAADASFELLLAEHAAGNRPDFFTIESWRVHAESAGPSEASEPTGSPSHDALAEATVKLRAGGRRLAVVGEGNGPVNALDRALRSAIEQVYPVVAQFQLTDFRVRIVDSGHGTDAVTRVLIETFDGQRTWVTIGVGPHIIDAAWQALVDSVTYGLCLQEINPVGTSVCDGPGSSMSAFTGMRI